MTPIIPSPVQILPGTRAKAQDALVINIFGGPGSGKSTLAAELFSELKKHHVEAACPEEHAKLAIWSGQPWLLDQQTVLLGRTWETIHALQDKVSVVIVDSPILLCSVYARNREPVCFHQMTADLHRRTNRINLLLERDPQTEYSTNGRRENESQARIVDEQILTTLDIHNEPFIQIARDRSDTDRIAEAVKQHLGVAHEIASPPFP
jgi:nicotinamide riboside kinase